MKQKPPASCEFLATSIGVKIAEKILTKPKAALVDQVVLFHPYTITSLSGGFKHVLLSPPFGEDSHFDEYFSDGLKPPTRSIMIRKK